MTAIKQARNTRGKKTVINDGDVPLPEKWLVRFRNPQGLFFVRQFHAPGFFEAYDTVMTYAEKLTLEILWFKEKRNCGLEYLSRNFPQLESFCTYCNKKFNHADPIQCVDIDCNLEFCSRQCALNHQNLRHHHNRS